MPRGWDHHDAEDGAGRTGNASSGRGVTHLERAAALQGFFPGKLPSPPLAEIDATALRLRNRATGMLEF